MPRRQYNIHEAKTFFSRLVADAIAGDEVVIARNGNPVAKLVPYRASDAPRRPGSWRGRVEMSPDFDVLPPEIESAFRADA